MSSRYSRRKAHIQAAILSGFWNRAGHGSVDCAGCGRMVPAIDPHGSYVCTCGKACYVEPPPATG